MTFIRMAGIALAFLLLGGCYARAAEECPENSASLKAIYGVIDTVAAEKRARYVTEEKPWADTGGTVLYALIYKVATYVGFFDKDGCLKFYSTRYPPGTVAAMGWGKSIAELFPREVET